MNVATRLGLYGAALVLVFSGAFVTAGAVVPQRTADAWTTKSKENSMSTTGSGRHAGHVTTSTPPSGVSVPGVTSAHRGYLLSPITAPATTGEAGTLSFRILDPEGKAVTAFAASHERKLHLIVVRTDGTQFRHVHPTMDSGDGTWSLPWEWAEAGTYRIYADFVPDTEDASTITLSRTIDVAGSFRPAPPTPTTTSTVDGFTVEVVGDIVAGTTSDLTFTVTQDGEPVATLQPHLGAFGHLVVLREGDLAYLHVHPEGDEPAPGELAGPEISFAAEVPTTGRYLLYLDFRVEGRVHSASFAVDTTGTTSATLAPGHEPSTDPSADHSH